MPKSIIHYGDSYKYSHSRQYPDNMIYMYDYMSSRGGNYPATAFVGLTYYIKKYLEIPVTKAEVYEIQEKAKLHGIPFDFDGWMHIANKHNGILPIKIKAVPEGSLIPVNKVLMTIESTDSEVPWIAGFVETILMKLWYPTTIATKSYYIKQMLLKYGSPEWAEFAYHNFGDRGSSSVESAAIGGFAHLTQFSGTDNFNSLDIATDSYNLDPNKVAGYSVYATEHSSTTAHQKEFEEEFVYNQLRENPYAPIMSFVADSYDVYNFTEFCTAPNSRIRKLIESRPHQKLILRPDSGEPTEVLEKMLHIMIYNNINIVPHEKVLFKDFGLLWGDGITPEVIDTLLNWFTKHKKSHLPLFAAENFVFGSGGDLMQNVTRDTQKFAIKCSSITTQESFTANEAGHEGISYYDIDVYKDPITDPGKASLKGKVTTWLNEATNEYFVDIVDFKTNDFPCKNMLETVFENGKLLINPTFDGIKSQS